MQEYDVKACVAGDLTEEELATCIAIIKSGDAVDPESAAAELPRASVLAVVRQGDQIVGVGAIKRVRRDYASRIAGRSGASFKPDTPELGYVAVDSAHRGNHLSYRIVAMLLSRCPGSLFATTSKDRMKQTLAKAGFVQKGREWKGQNNYQLSVWIRE